MSRPIVHNVWATGGTKATASTEQVDTWTVANGGNYEDATTIERIIGEISLNSDQGDVGVYWAIIHSPAGEYETADINPGVDIDNNRFAQAVLVQGCCAMRSANDAVNNPYQYRVDYKGNRKMLKNDKLAFVVYLDNAISMAWSFTLKILHKPF